MPNLSKRNFMAVSELAKVLGITRQAVFERIKTNKVPYEMLGNIAIIKREHLPLVYKIGKAGRPKTKL